MEWSGLISKISIEPDRPSDLEEIATIESEPDSDGLASFRI